MKSLFTGDRPGLLALGLVALLLVLLPWLEAGGREGLGGWLDMCAHVLALALAALALAAGGGIDRRLLLAWLPAAVLLAVSAALAPYRFAALLRVFELATAAALALALAALLARMGGESGRRRLGALLVMAALPAALAAIWMAATGAGRGRAGFVNPNHLAALLVCCLPLALMMERRRRWLRWPLGGILAAGLLATGSRSALVAAAVVVVALMVGAARLNLCRGRRLAAAVVVSLLLGGVAGGTLWARFADGSDIYRYDRLRIWPQVLQMSMDAPLAGIGPGQFSYRAGAYNFPRREEVVHYGRAFHTPHSTPLLVLAEIGVPGALAILLALIFSIRHARRGWQQESQAERHMALAAATGLAALGVVSLFDEPLARPPLLLAASVLAALALPPAPRRRPGSAFWPATAGLLLVAVLVGMIIQPTRAQALALKAAGTTHPARQAELLADARRVLPGQVHYALAEGKLLLRHAARPLDLKSYARIRVVADRAVALDPRRADGHLLRARLERRACIELLRTEASCARATADYRLAVLAAPTDALLLREQAGLARLLGRPGDAAAGLRQAVALEPAFVRAWSDLVDLAREEQAGAADLARLDARLVDARRRARRAVPNSSYARDILQPDAEGGPVARGGGG
jgi:O-antigen ligase